VTLQSQASVLRKLMQSLTIVCDIGEEAEIENTMRKISQPKWLIGRKLINESEMKRLQQYRIIVPKKV